MSINNFQRLRRRCKESIAPTVSLPDLFFTVTPGSIRAAYLITYPERPPVIRYIVRFRDEVGAKFLLRRGIVSGYDLLKDTEPVLYHTCTFQDASFKVVLPWEKVGSMVTSHDVRKWAISAEFKRCLMGRPLNGKRLKKAQKGSVLPMFCQTQNKQAA